jgi:catechol 2,3-dioxygenase
VVSLPNKVKPIYSSQNPIDPGVDIGHVHLKTADLQRVKDFYVEILGFDVVAEIPKALFIAAGGYHHHLAFNTWESANGLPPEFGRTGLYHVAIRYPSRGALGEALLRLQQANWPLVGVNDHGTHEALYLNDPDENGLELYWDRPEKDWPVDADGHLVFDRGNMLDIKGLLAEGNKYRKEKL